MNRDIHQLKVAANCLAVWGCDFEGPGSWGETKIRTYSNDSSFEFADREPEHRDIKIGMHVPKVLYNGVFTPFHAQAEIAEVLD